MRRRLSLMLALVLSAPWLSSAALAGAVFVGPGPGLTGNDTGGIIPYSPVIEGIYPQMAADYCARWGRLSHVTSVHRRYGDYISFVCIDKPWVIH